MRGAKVERHRARIIGTPHNGVRGHNEFFERTRDVGKIFVDVKMIGLNIQYHCNGWRQREKRTIVFVSLDHKRAFAAESEIAFPTTNAATNNSGGIEPGRGQCVRRHDCCSCFAVRPRNRNQRPTTDGLRECFRATNHG